MKFLVPFIVAYLGKKIIFHFLGFSYDPYNDPFEVVMLLIDVGVFLVLWVLGIGIYNYFFDKNKPVEND